jgi:hypothetical protein
MFGRSGLKMAWHYALRRGTRTGSRSSQTVRVAPSSLGRTTEVATWTSTHSVWTTDGVALCSAIRQQDRARIVSDGAGGAIVTWLDYRSDGAAEPEDEEIYAQRVDASGVVQWEANGVALCTATGDQHFPWSSVDNTIVSDGAGGAIVTWYDYRNGTNFDIYAQRVNVSGEVQWTTDGVPLCTTPGWQWYPDIIPDGAGGAIVTWSDTRNGNWDTYAQRVNASGVVQWTTDGMALCTATSTQENTQIASDGAGGAIVTWEDYRSASDIYAQRVDASGAVQWTADGVALCTATSAKNYIRIVSEGAGGAIVAWVDRRSGNEDIYAQHVTQMGNIGADPVPIPASAILIIVLAVGSLGAGWLWKRRAMHH